MKNFTTRLAIITSLIAFTITIPPTVNAQQYNISDQFYPPNVITKPPQNLGDIYGPIITTAYGIGGIMSFLGILYGGFLFIQGGGQGNAQQLEQGKKTLTWSLVGLVVLISVYWIVRIIEIISGVNILNVNL